MNWRKVHKTIKRKPFLLDPLRVQNLASAKKMLLQEGIPSHSHMLHMGLLHSGMDQAQWEAYLGVSEKRLLRKCRMTAPVRVGSIAYISRRALVAVILFTAMFLLMACTPTGRALTKAIYNSVVEVIGDFLYVGTKKQTKVSLETLDYSSEENTVIYYPSLEAALTEIDMPVCYLNDSNAVVNKIHFFSSELFGNSLETEYIFHDDVLLIFHQVWNEGQPIRIILDDTKQYVQLNITDTIAVDGAYIQPDERFTGTISTDTTTIHILIEGISSLEDATYYLHSLTFK